MVKKDLVAWDFFLLYYVLLIQNKINCFDAYISICFYKFIFTNLST